MRVIRALAEGGPPRHPYRCALRPAMGYCHHGSAESRQVGESHRELPIHV
jgi:hypothetical protein